MQFPITLRYSPQHMWVSVQEDGTLLAGITDHAQTMLGDIVFVEAPAPGNHVTAGTPCGVVESVKTASDLYAPVSGNVIEINPELQNTPEMINAQPYAAWIFRMRPDTAADLEQLLDAQAYEALLSP